MRKSVQLVSLTSVKDSSPHSRNQHTLQTYKLVEERQTYVVNFIQEISVLPSYIEKTFNSSEQGTDMYFHHSDSVWNRFSDLCALTLVMRGVVDASSVGVDVSSALADIEQMLNSTPEGELASIRAWRQAYAKMGLKPTQYRCAAEALLRRFRKDRSLPIFHPLVDVLNVESMRAAIPIAAFDVAHIAQGITVRPASGREIHTTFQGETEHPDEGEIIFVDAKENAHSRRWVYRQGSNSVVRPQSDVVLIVAEALHMNAQADLLQLKARLLERAGALGIEVSEVGFINQESRKFEYGPASVRPELSYATKQLEIS